MYDDQLQDLKQFITATVSQQTDDIRQDLTRLEHKFDNLEHKFENLEQKVDKGFADLTEIIDNRVEPVEQEVADHKQRITKLESA